MATYHCNCFGTHGQFEADTDFHEMGVEGCTRKPPKLSPAQRFFDSSVRVEKLMWIPGIAAEPSEELEDFLDQELPDASQVKEALPWLEALYERHKDVETVLGEFVWKRVEGFLAMLSTPIPQQFFNLGYQCSWGYTQQRWVYAKDLDELTDIAEAFHAEVVAKTREKLAKKGSKV